MGYGLSDLVSGPKRCDEGLSAGKLLHRTDQTVDFLY